MYLAYTKKKGLPHFILRESIETDGRLSFRNLFELGPDPGVFIQYAGGNAFYLDEALEDSLCASGADFDRDALEDLFWPFVRPDIRRAVEVFRNRSSAQKPRKLTREEADVICRSVHAFDKRRSHFLKFGAMDQGPVENMPAVLFREHSGRCRDEIEQRFSRRESVLRPRELKSYVYTIFDLQRFFSGMFARKMPHVLDQNRVDDHFLAEICRINRELFCREDTLDPHLIRYVIMFFDYLYADTTLLDDLSAAFMNRHRVFTPRPEKPMAFEKALAAFGLDRSQFDVMTRRQVTRLYRKLAPKAHPDTGGSDERFVRLKKACEALLEAKG